MNARRWMAACLASAALLVQTPPAFAVEPPTSSLEVHVDPRVELASMLASMTDWAREGAELPDTQYATDTMKTFGRYNKHEAVQACQEWFTSGTGNLSLLLRLAMTLTPDCKSANPLEPTLSTQAGGYETAKQITAQLIQFATDTSFERYFQTHAPFYSKLESRVSHALAATDPIRRVEAYYGEHQEHYAVILAPLAPKEREGLTVAADTSSPMVIMRANDETKDNQPDFKEDDPAFSREICHAFGHVFLRAAGRKANAELDQSIQLFKPIEEDMKAAACPTWQDAFEEHVLRAIDARFLQADGEGKRAQLDLRANERAGFAYIRDLFDQLASFESSRKQFLTIDAFFPTILARVSYLCDTGAEQDVAKRYTSFQGPISRSLDKHFAPALVIVKPTPTDPKLLASMGAYIQSVQALFRKRLRQEIKIVSPEEAAKLDPSKTGYLIFGTPWSNPFLAALMKYIPLKISKDTVQLGGKQFIGQNLRVITSFSNPYNAKLPMTIFTGTEDKSMNGIFSLPYGPTDYIVYHDNQPISEGDFVYDLRGRWSLP